MRRNLLALLLVAPLSSAACHNEYWFTPQQFQKLAYGPAPVVDGDEVQRRLLISPELAVPVRRNDVNEEARVCADALQIYAAKLVPVPVEGAGDPKMNTIVVPAFIPRTMLITGVPALVLGGVFLVAGTVLLSAHPQDEKDALNKSIGGGLAVGVSVPLLAVGLGLTIAGAVQKQPESCRTVYRGMPPYPP